MDGRARSTVTPRCASWPALALMRRTEKGKHNGQVTAKALAVLEALRWGHHNAKPEPCFPSYETIAEDDRFAQLRIPASSSALMASATIERAQPAAMCPMSDLGSAFAAYRKQALPL
jgi:hypothetical protein